MTNRDTDMNEKTGYPVKAIANYFLRRHRKEGITPLKIQKLVYIAYGWYLAYHEDPLINDEYPEAWTHGPVFPTLYREFRHRRHLPIMDLATNAYLDANGNFVEEIPEIDKGDEDALEFLGEVWKAYGQYTALQLSELCHRAGTPWAETRKKDARRNAHISDGIIRKYYRELREREPENG